ncbi:MAG: TonB-dependent receptor [Bacteroidaceae bacterium]|nr:TonB-dependent receptor [Bacteroidaceae bacterium]
MQNVLLSLLCALGAAILPSSLKAQDADSLCYELTPLVTVVERRVGPETSAVPFRRTDAGDVTRYGMRTLSEAIRMMPGVQVQDYGGVGGLKSVSVRGLGAKHTAVSYDGVVVSDAQSGMVDLGRFSLENVSAVSLVLGHCEVALNTAREYSLASLVSMNGSLATSGKVVSSARIMGGSFGLAGLSACGGLSDKDGAFAASFAGNYLRSDGMYPFTLVNAIRSTREKRRDSDIESLTLEGNLRADVLGGLLKSKVYYYDSERGLPGAVNLYNKDNKERLWNRNLFAQAVYDHALSGSVDMRVVAKYDRNYSRYNEVNKNYAAGEQTDKNLQNEYYLSLAVAKCNSGRFGCSLASDVSYATLENNFENSRSPRRLSSYTALAASYRWDAVGVVASLLATYMKDDVSNGVSPSPFRRLSPSLSVSVKPLGSGRLMLRVSFKDSYRVPTFADLYYLRHGNMALRPERATQYNVGFTWWGDGSCCGARGYALMTADFYYNNVRDKIVALPTMYVWRMMNFGRADIFGADVSLSLRSEFAGGLALRADVAYSWQYAVDVTDSSAKNYRHQLPYTPEHSGNFSFTFENPIVDVTYMLSAVGERYMLPQNTERNLMNGYVEHSFVLNRELPFGGNVLHLQAKLMNVGNEQYEVIRYYPMPGFSWQVSAGVKF